ncbi:hypothetical protein HELRODRAFT_166676 [Helobdella robusta]|uniref:Uncharacterized protein n=1 Tax=Helobdella robusta TaxID=6412 RepID=T1EYC4_HELRO|nr:hypothetical protein HELRODRAFT_166676 [Helobdella robusta]ESO11662.1 hypothetical protein HELRODRAFT_166676 [Helobdella robusta]
MEPKPFLIHELSTEMPDITTISKQIYCKTCNVRLFVKELFVCFKIFSQSEGKPYKAQLDNEIKKIPISYAAGRMNSGNMKVELDLFKNSIHLLTMFLVFNESVMMGKECLEVVREYFDESTIPKLTNIHSKWHDLQRNTDSIDVSTTLLINLLLTISSLEFCQSENISAHDYEKEFLNLCLRDESILRDFSDYLIKLGQTFEIFYNIGKSEMDYYFGWRNGDDNGMSYETMLNWFDVLIHESNNDDVIMLTSQTLSRAANESDVNVFRTICNELGKFDFLEEWIFN